MSTRRSHLHLRQRWQNLILLVPLSLLCSCGKDNNWKEVFPVRGSLFVDGKPAEGAFVTFLAEEDLANPRALRSTAVVQADGTFRVTTYLAEDGAPAGKHIVTAYWPEPLPENSSPTDVGRDRLQGRYVRSDNPLAHVTVEEQENVLEPFQVDSK